MHQARKNRSHVHASQHLLVFCAFLAFNSFGAPHDGKCFGLSPPPSDSLLHLIVLACCDGTHVASGRMSVPPRNALSFSATVISPRVISLFSACTGLIIVCCCRRRVHCTSNSVIMFCRPFLLSQVCQHSVVCSSSLWTVSYTHLTLPTILRV